MAQGTSITGTEAVKGKTVKCDGSYGLHSYTLLPIPENPPTIVDRWGNEWLYLGDADEEFNRVAKADKNGRVDIATLGHMRKDYFI